MNEKEVREYFLDNLKNAPKEVVEAFGEGIFGNRLGMMEYEEPELRTKILNSFKKLFNVPNRNIYSEKHIRIYASRINEGIYTDNNEGIIKEIKRIDKEMTEQYM